MAFSHEYTRKRRHEHEAGPHKKIRLDTLLERLTLEPKSKIRPSYTVNPLLEKNTKGEKRVTIDELISERIIKEYQNKVLEDYAVIKWVLPLYLIMFHFQRWVKRLFNNFVREFNESNPQRKPVRLFRDYGKIMSLVHDPQVQLSARDLGSILSTQNAAERRKLQLKNDKKMDSARLQEIHDEEQLARECKYTYWDKVASLPEEDGMEIDI